MWKVYTMQWYTLPKYFSSCLVIHYAHLLWMFSDRPCMNTRKAIAFNLCSVCRWFLYFQWDMNAAFLTVQKSIFGYKQLCRGDVILQSQVYLEEKQADFWPIAAVGWILGMRGISNHFPSYRPAFEVKMFGICSHFIWVNKK